MNDQELRVKALELAAELAGGGSWSEGAVLAVAQAYCAFLRGGDQGTAKHPDEKPKPLSSDVL